MSWLASSASRGTPFERKIATIKAARDKMQILYELKCFGFRVCSARLADIHKSDEEDLRAENGASEVKSCGAGETAQRRFIKVLT